MAFMRFLITALLSVLFSSGLMGLPFPSETGKAVTLAGGLADANSKTSLTEPECIVECMVIGSAFRIADKTRVYREEHRLSRVNGQDRREVFYRNNQDAVFAYKLVDSDISNIAPDYWFADFRLDNFQFAARAKESELDQGLLTANASIDSKAFIQEYSDIWFASDLASDELYDYFNTMSDRVSAGGLGAFLDDGLKGGHLIADAGFDAFVRKHWDKLLKQSIQFRFVLPSRETALPMAIAQIAKERCESSVFGAMHESHIPGQLKSGYKCFRIKARNWLISQLVGSIYLVYDSNKQLAIFKGLSNIRDDGNKRLYTYITYQYL